MKTLSILLGISLICLFSNCSVQKRRSDRATQVKEKTGFIENLSSQIFNEWLEKKNGTYNLHPTVKTWPKNIPKN